MVEPAPTAATTATVTTPGEPPSAKDQQRANTPLPTVALAGRFELLDELGRGSSGTVYRARLLADYKSQPAGTEVAIKFLRQELAADERARARLFAEGELGRSLRHDNLATMHGVETVDQLGVQTTFLVMQYVRGTTLRDFLVRSGTPVEDLTRRIGADACRGLWELHRRGLVHRDVKPENLLLTPESQLKIVDLGLARPFGSHGGGSGSGSGSGGSPGQRASSSGLGVAGSIAYAAPETLRGEPAGPRSDLYSLGIVLFELTTGRHPFADATTPDDMMHAQLQSAPPRPSHLRARVSPFLEQVLLDLLHKQPEERPRDAAELARVLDHGERSEYWRRHEQRAPVLASSRRLLRLRRPAETAFFGRSDEIEALDEALAAARDGRGRTVVVTGPDGIGRRRLLDEVLQRWLDGRDPPLLLGGEADTGLSSAEPFASSLLDWLLRGDDLGSPNAQHRAVASARSLFGLDETDATAVVAAASGQSQELPEVRADRLASALQRLAPRGQTLVLRVDRADELDTSGRLVLHRLAAAAGKASLLLVLAAGPDFATPDGAVRLELAGLGERDFLAFGSELFRAGEAATDYLRQAHQVLSGLPGSLIEALEELSAEGALRGRPGDYHDLASDAEPRPARSLVARFQARVASFEPAARRVLSAAAVLGERCALPELTALVGAPELAVLETLSRFRGRIVRAQGGEVSFRHRDFRQALLRALPEAERQQLHLDAARRLEQLGSDPLQIGLHRSQALDHQGCLDPLLAGLEERVRAGSRRTALRLVGRLAVHFEHVATTPENRQRRLRSLLLAGQARVNAGQNDAAARAFRDAEALARELGDLDLAAAARTGLATYELDSGRLLSAITLLESVHDDLAARDTTAADAYAAEAHGLHGRILLYRGQAGEGLKQLQAALRRLPPHDEGLRCHVLIDLARVQALSHHYATAMKTLQEVEQSPATRHRPRVRLRFHLYRGQVRSVCGDDDASQDLRTAIEESQALSLPTYGARAALFLGERRFWRRRDADAELMFRLAIELARAGGDRLGEAMARGNLVRLGHDDPTLSAFVDELALPSLRANLLLALAGRGLASEADRHQLADLLDGVDLPLAMHLRALAWLDRPASARALVRSIAVRFPQRSVRQRFLAEWGHGARV